MDLIENRPVGRVPATTSLSKKLLKVTANAWSIDSASGDFATLAEDVLPKLDELHDLAIEQSSDLGEKNAELFAEFLQSAAARGTVISGEIRPEVRACLPSGLNDVIPDEIRETRPRDLDWDVLAASQRREAMIPMVDDVPSVTAVLVSRRPELVVDRLVQLQAQTYPNLDILVGLHGVDASEDLLNYAKNHNVKIIRYGADDMFGSVLQSASEAAQGDLITKIDDDDFYGPDHVWDLVLALTYSGATMVGKSTTVVYLEALDTTVRRVFGANESFTHRVAGGTILISKKSLAEVGGWPAVPRGVDTELINAVTAIGGTIYKPHDIGYLYVRNVNAGDHTWATGEAHFLDNARQQWVGLLQHSAFGTLEKH